MESAAAAPPANFGGEPAFQPAPVQQRPSFFQHPQNAEQKLQREGLEFHGFLKTEVSSNFHSGLSGDGTGGRSLLETSAALDLGKMAGWSGARVDASFHDYIGDAVSDGLIGDAQGFSNIEARPVNRIYELWFEQTLDSGKVRLKLGRIDGNTEFAYVENAGDFLNSSMGYSPTILGMNSYPNLRLGGVLALKPWGPIFATLGDFQCPTHGNMALGETGFRWGTAGTRLPGRLAVGSWIHPHRSEGYLGQRGFGVHGMYVVAEETVWSHKEEGADFRGVRAFAQWGDANPIFSDASRHEGAGVEWVGPLAIRSKDAVGVGETRVSLGSEYYDANCTGRERAIESFYKLGVRNWWSVTADLQLIHTTSQLNITSQPNATRPYAATMRMVFSY